MEHSPDETASEYASKEAVHKTKNAQAAIELAREVQLAEAIAKTASETKAALLEGLREVFGEGDEKRDPEQMQILIRRIPLICQDVRQIHVDVADIKGNLKWGVRTVIGAVLLAVMKLILIP